MAKLLIIGGTRFLGYFVTQTALERGHEVTLFNRGKSAPEAYPQVEHIRGDRDADIDLLAGRQWDSVVDTSGYFPRIVGKSAQLLAGSVPHYVFVSSISAYAEPLLGGADEDAPRQTLEDPTVEEVRGDTYGGLKALCEQVVREAYPGGALVVRPTLIVGPRDPTDRFSYWVRRIAQGGEVLAPAEPDRPVQLIDARDLAAWIVSMAENQATGVFNGAGPATPLTMGEFLETARKALDSDARFTWVDERFLLERDVAPWMELPVWVPEEIIALHRVRNDRALAAGLSIRPLEDTVRATHQWMQENPEQSQPQGTLTPEREQELLREWHASGQEASGAERVASAGQE
ncbi:MAG: SDR family oxidoreductase [Chloroflexota bacterium]|nr:SDR family oxidoreductase [Chloroflexota bacterium]MDQ5865226.1 SDR family oxidoreductase [Chloroflexota bacterium]